MHFMGLRNKALLMLFIDSALRLEEMGKLNLSDLNLAEGYVLVLGKGNRQDFCPFSPKTAAVLEAYCAARATRAKTGRLWITEDGRPLTSEGIRAWFRMLKSAAKVTSPGGVHRLRHTAALAYLRATRDPFLLQLFLRHTDLTMSRRYVQGLKKEDAIHAHHNGGSPVENLGIE
jgi:site-specific recombinase XerD